MAGRCRFSERARLLILKSQECEMWENKLKLIIKKSAVLESLFEDR